MKGLLRKVKRIADKCLGTNAGEILWRFRHFLDKRWAERYISEESLAHPHRQLLIEKISAYAPFEMILEVGSASGPNLYLLAKKFPDVTFYGIDVSGKAISTGKKWLKNQGISNVFLSRGTARKLKKFSDKSIDVIFTDATLIYVGPDKIEESLRELFRVAKKTLILNEWHVDNEKSLYRDHWLHNYKVLFEKLAPASKITLTKIPENVWGGEWAKYGYIIECALKK